MRPPLLLPPQARQSWFDAAERGDAEALQRLTSRVPVDVMNDEQQTALHLAVEGGSLPAVQVLLAAGAANAGFRGWGKGRLLQAATSILAADSGGPIVRALLEAGAPTLAMDENGLDMDEAGR